MTLKAEGYRVSNFWASTVIKEYTLNYRGLIIMI